MSDVPYGVLLSGGLDSSLVASIASRHAARTIKDGKETGAPFPRLHTFSVGMEGSSDLPKAKMVADFLGAFYNCLVLVVLTTF